MSDGPVPMDKEYIRSNHVIERYLLGGLSDAETEQFEEQMLSSPELANEVESAWQFLETVKQAPPDQASAASIGPGSPVGVSGREGRARYFQLAASFLLGGILTAFVLGAPLLMEKASPPGIAGIFYVEAVRTQQENVPDTLNAGETVVLVISPGQYASTYDLELQSSAGKTARKSRDHAASPDGQAIWQIQVPDEPGTYRIVVFSSASNDPVLSQPVIVR